MKKNMGSADRVIRILVAVVIANQITGTAAIILGLFAVVFVATSFISFCPLYTIFGISTQKKSAQ